MGIKLQTAWVLLGLFAIGESFCPVFAAEEKKEPPLPATTVASPVPNAVPARPAPPAVADVQRELQEIIKIHQALQAQHVTQIREIQRIMEQARLHQQLLKNLAPARAMPTAPAASQAPGARNIEDMIRLQKIQLLQQQATQNRTRLEELSKEEKEAKAAATPPQEEAKKTSE